MALQEIDHASRIAASKANLAAIEVLAERIASEPELFARGDASLSGQTLEATKKLFDLALSTEFGAFAAISETLQSLFSEQEGPSAATRGGKRKRGDEDDNNEATDMQKTLKVEPTPLGELTVTDMDGEQVWQQLEMRASRICGVLDRVITSEGGQLPEEDEDEDEGEDKEKNGGDQEGEEDDDLGAMPKQKIVHSLRDLSDADLRAMGLDSEGIAELRATQDGAGEDDSEDDWEDEEEEEENENVPEPYPGTSDLSDEEEAGMVTLEPLLSEEEQQRRKQEAERRELMQMRNHKRLAKMMMGRDPDEESEEDDDEDDDEGIDPELAKYMQQSVEEEEDDLDEDEQGDDEDDEDDEDEDDDEATAEHKRRIGILDNLDAPGSSQQKGGRGSERKHPTLDDDFFSIDQFNRDTDDYGDEGVDLGDDVDLFAAVDGQVGEDDDEEAEEDEQIMYGDFFAPPASKRGRGQPKGKGKGKASSITDSEQVESQKAKVDDSNVSAAVSMARGDHAKVEEVETRQQAADEPRKRVLRFHDQVAVRRIKARKKRDQMEMMPEVLRAMQQGQAATDGEEDESMSWEDVSEDEAEDAEGSPMEEDDEEDNEEGEEDDEEEEDDNEMREGMDEERDEDDDDELPEDDLAAQENEIAHRVAGDLFADDEVEKGPAKESTHERKMRGLQEEIARLEQENVDRKDWTLMGEAGAKARPENSLLEQDLEFENTAKVKPVVTEETTQSLEDMIKQRILEGRFDDVQRRLNIEAMPFLPSRMLELSDQKSGRSLAEIYEDQYEDQKATESGQVRTPEQDRKLEEEHREIDELFDDINGKLDALTNAHFTPKAPKASIQTLTNAPAITMESSLPATASGRSMLAPEEVYDAGRHNVSMTGDRSEMTPEEKQRLQRKLRADKAARNSRIEDARQKVEINRAAVGAGPGGPKGRKAEEREKEEALKRLMGNKGVSVVGKGNEEKRGNGKGKATPANGKAVSAANLRL